MVRIKLSWVEASQSLWRQTANDRSEQSSKFVALKAAIRFLFRPRPWVKSIARCVQGVSHLHHDNWFAVHVRNSPEKSAEMKKTHSGIMPSMNDQFSMTRSLAVTLNASRVLLQTASPSSLRAFEEFARESRLSLTYTNNSREEHDNWGGWKADHDDIATSTATVAAVNAYLGSIAPVFMSPDVSAWTFFVSALMAPTAPRVPMCCVKKMTTEPKVWSRQCPATTSALVTQPRFRWLESSIPVPIVRHPANAVAQKGSVTLPSDCRGRPKWPHALTQLSNPEGPPQCFSGRFAASGSRSGRRGQCTREACR